MSLLTSFRTFLMCGVLALLCCASVHAATPFPPDIAGWTDAEKAAQRQAGQTLIALIKTAAEQGDTVLNIPPAHYRFDKDMLNGSRNAHLVLSNLHNMTIDFQGSTLWFEQTFGGVLVGGCSDLTIRNLFIDWDPLPFSQGEVIAVDNATRKIVVRIDPAYAKVGASVTEERDYRATTFDPTTRRLRPEQGGYVLRHGSLRDDGDYDFDVGVFYDRPLAATAIAVGDPIAIFARMGRAWRIENCDRFTLEDVTLYASPFVAFAQTGGSGRSVYRRVSILRRPGTDRLMAGNADGINVSNLEVGPLLEDCHMDVLGDDFVNIHAQYVRVLAQEESGALITSRLPNSAPSRLAEGKPTTVTLYSRSDMRLLGQRKVISYEKVADYVPEKGACLANLDNAFHSGIAASLKYGVATAVHRLQLDAPIELGPDPILVCDDYICAGAEIHGGSFKGTLARGFRLQSPDVLVSGCTIADTLGPAISCSGQPGYWGEGPYVHRATIRDNTFIDTSMGLSQALPRAAIVIESPAGPESTFRQSTFLITGNRFEQMAGQAIHAELVDDITIRDNAISGFATRPNQLPGTGSAVRIGVKEHGHPVVLAGCSDDNVSNNAISNPGPYSNAETILRLATPTTAP